MKFKYFTIALAAGALVAVLGLPDIADAGGHGGGGGGHGGGGFGGGHGGGFGGAHGGFGGHMGGMPMRSMGGMGMRGAGAMSFSRSGSAVRSYGMPHGSRFTSQSFHAGAGHIGSQRYNRSNFAVRRPPGINRVTGVNRVTNGNISRRAVGIATVPKSNFSATNLRHLATNRPLQQATLARHNAFFNSAFAHNHNGQWNNHWRDHYGRWYGYRWGGAVFWPYWFGDYFSYAFWPSDYYDTFWGYGPDAILGGAFWPYGEYTYDDDYAYDGAYTGDIYRPYRRRAAGGPAPADPAAGVETCAGFAPGVSDLPIDQLGKIVDATEEQRTAFDDLKSATVKASEILKQSCSSETPLTPVSRLEAMQRRLQAMAEANEVIRTPLVHLYGLLTDTQKQRLATLAQPNMKRAQTARAKEMNIAELCSSQTSFTNVPADQIASTIQLTDAQKQELEKLKAASAKASDNLKGGCPATVPDTMEGRLDAAQQRVTALITAVDTVRPAVSDFYASLTDEQKAALSIQPGEKQTANNRG